MGDSCSYPEPQGFIDPTNPKGLRPGLPSLGALPQGFPYLVVPGKTFKPIEFQVKSRFMVGQNPQGFI
jgi:hypothetical protein